MDAQEASDWVAQTTQTRFLLGLRRDDHGRGPGGRELSLAVTAMEESEHWLLAALALIGYVPAASDEPSQELPPVRVFAPDQDAISAAREKITAPAR